MAGWGIGIVARVIVDATKGDGRVSTTVGDPMPMLAINAHARHQCPCSCLSLPIETPLSVACLYEKSD